MTLTDEILGVFETRRKAIEALFVPYSGPIRQYYEETLREVKSLERQVKDVIAAHTPHQTEG